MLNVARKFINSASLNLLGSLFAFLFVFFTPLNTSLNKYGGNYIHSPDTSVYFRLIFDPWKIIRTLGQPLFLNLFLEPHWEQFENVLKNASKPPWGEVYSLGKRFPEFVNTGDMQEVFDNIVLCQKLLLSFGAAFLLFACSLYFNALVIGGCFFLAYRLRRSLIRRTFLLKPSPSPFLFFYRVPVVVP